MVYILRTTKTLKNGETVTYLYLAHNIKKQGITVKEWMLPLGPKSQAEETLRDIALHQKSFHPERAEHLSSALLGAYLDILESLELVSTVNLVAGKKRSQGLSPGEYLLFCILNRLTKPKSHNQLQEWFEGTILKELYLEGSQYLTAQHFWNHFEKYFTPALLPSIYLLLAKKTLAHHELPVSTLLIDSTNFYTYISDHSFNKLPKKGHGKDGRKHLNLINFSLVLEKEREIPLYYKTYPGNIPDVTHFKELLPELSGWFEQLELETPELTLVFDKGNNSEDAMKSIDENRWKFIGSLRPSMFKALLQEPFTEFSKIYDTRKNHPIYAFRREAKVYTDTPRVIIVTFDEAVHDKNLHLLTSHLAKRFDQLREFTITKLNTKPQWLNPDKIKKHIAEQILKQKDFKKIIEIVLETTVREAVSYQELRWGLNEKAFTKKINPFGKSIIFSNHTGWSTKEIVLVYRQQFKIEKKFSDMKSGEYIRARPVRHWTDDKIHMHLFICTVALLVQSLLKIKLNSLKIKGSFRKHVRDLEKIHKINLFYNKGTYKKAILPHLTQHQSRLFSKLRLERYFS